MDRKNTQHSELVERYLQGRLTPEEEQAFEEAYLADPRLLEEVQLAERLRAGFKDAAGADLAPQSPRRAAWLGFAGSPRYGIAASFVAAVALVTAGGLFVENQALEETGGSDAAHHTRVVPLIAVRGGRSTNVVAAPAPDEWTVLLLDTGFADYDVFSAALLRAGTDDEVLRLDDMIASDGTVAFGMPGSALAPGDYEVRLLGGRRDSAAGEALAELSRTSLTIAPRP
jgi:hypothetical protein